jgi:hypothetical protein
MMRSFGIHGISRQMIYIFLLGFVIRLFACQYTFVVNPDGTLYIHQARAIYYGLWDSLLRCQVGGVSNYVLLVAGFYRILGDWVVAAKSVSFIFGTMTLIPLYFLLKRFFEENIALLSTLIFALLPVFVARSADVIRDPVYWFFLVLGLYLFVSQIEKRNYLYLLLSSLCFVMGTWARVEGILFILTSSFYVLLLEKERKLEKLAIFVAPIVFLLVFSLAGSLFFDLPTEKIFRLHEVVDKFFQPIIKYKNLRAGLEGLTGKPLMGVSEHFLQKVRNLIWFVALGTIFRYLVEAYFYFFFLIFIVGLKGIWKRIKSDRRILYLALNATCALILLYVHVLEVWVIFYRFLAVFILPSFVIIGFGLEKIIFFLRSRFHLKDSVALLILCLFILACALPKNLEPHERDKLVFKDIGEFIANREGNSQKIGIAASVQSIRWVSFYANLDYAGAPCPLPYIDFKEIVGDSYQDFVRNLKKDGMRYFLWEERHWPAEAFDFMKEMKEEDFKALGNWYHPDTGRMILFKVT